MVFQVTAVGGEPSSGKTTLFRKLMKATGGGMDWLRLKENLIVFHENSELKTLILGDYDDNIGLFAGTDKLSMAVQGRVEKALHNWERNGILQVILEGDRLYTHSFFTFVKEMGAFLKIFELTVSSKISTNRHKERGDTQKETWLKGRMTKLANIRKAWDVTLLPNENEEDLGQNVELLKELIDKKGLYS